jgi:hypothetical protein
MWARAVLAPSLLMNAASSLLRRRRITHRSSPRKLAGLSNHRKIGAVERYSKKITAGLLAHEFDKDKMMEKRLPYERLDQLTVDILLGVR